MRILLIYNPFTENRIFKKNLDYVCDRFQQKGIQVIIYRITNKDLLIETISEINSDQYIKIVIVGDNKLVNIVISNLLKYQVNIPVAIFPRLDIDENKILPETVNEMFNIVLADNYIDNPNVIHFRTEELTFCDNSLNSDKKMGVYFPFNIKVILKKIEVNTLLACKRLYRNRKYINFNYVKRAAGHISKAVIYEFRHPKVESHKKRNIFKDILEVIKDLPRHNPFHYINSNTINDSYFENAFKTIDNGYIYIIISSTGSPASEVIRRMIKREYSHASISFDEDLKTIISYNGGQNITPPGLNKETINFFYQKPDASIIVYRLKANRNQKTIILNEIKRINEQGSSFNLFGFSYKKNIMFCSQFVYNMLKAANLDYFNKRPDKVKPTDFVELDYGRALEYCNRFYIKDIINTTIYSNILEKQEIIN